MSPLEENRILYRRAPAGVRRRGLEQFARRLETEVTGGRPFSCLITNDRELHRLNLQFLGKDRPTDVLSFPAAEPDGPLGELAISGDRALAEALARGHSAEEEIRILMLHGVLHLMGLDHEKDRGRMRRTETAWRRKLDLPAGLIERVRA